MASNFQALWQVFGAPALWSIHGVPIGYRSAAAGPDAAPVPIVALVADEADERLVSDDGVTMLHNRRVTVLTDPTDTTNGGVASPSRADTVLLENNEPWTVHLVESNREGQAVLRVVRPEKLAISARGNWPR